MRFEATDIAGCYLIETEPRVDARGSFTRLLDVQLFSEHARGFTIRQVNRSWNPTRGTLRGMHLQLPPCEETKVVWCSRGEIHDVVVDLRPASGTYMQSIGFRLGESEQRLLLVPPGCGHGFQTLSEDVEIVYFISNDYIPALARTVRWNDPALGMAWPLPVSIISDADATAPDYDPLRPVWPG